MARPGIHNGLTDVPGLRVGHFSDPAATSGTTVVLCDPAAVAGVDVRGSAPGTRETDLLDPSNLVERVDAIVLSGGSVYGLATADGVVRWLAEQGRGFPLGAGHVAPIVPAAMLFDLGRGANFVPPVSGDWGRKACEAASDGPVPIGCVGAGTGACSGPLKGGLGTASLVLESGLTVAAMVAVNSLGTTIDPARGRPWEIGQELDGEFGDQGRRAVRLPEAVREGSPGQNTTIGLVACDARLTKAQARKLAQMAHDGLARAIRPAHTMFDGDTLFALGTGRQALPEAAGVFAVPEAPAINDLGAAAADCMSRAVVRAILAAESGAGVPAFRDLPAR